MSEYENILRIIKELEDNDLKQVKSAIDEIHAIVCKYGDHGNMALSLVGSALADGKVPCLS